MNRSKSLMHNKWKQMQEAYYKELAGVITKYDNVFLFGLTKAKIELYKYLNKDSYFRDISIAIQSTDKITENEKEAFVVNHFENI
ncbi:hypothetical protein [Maribacter antarcticus]|uniref:hypothetical protein n=1 Tax=Maribacter antarcticus TaxID=505250 RepID=UPI001FDF57F6|nr:hypothetical protein [Maribacter antarcticus]